MTYQPQLPLPGPTGAQDRPARDGEDWRIDEPTRLAGRRGVAAARAALARSTETLGAGAADAA